MNEPLAFRIADITRPNGLFGRTKLYEAIKTGQLIAHKHGRNTIILAENYKKYLDALPKLVMAE